MSRLLKAGVFSALCLALGIQTSNAAQAPVEAFGNLPFMGAPQLSPDGKHFAVIQSLHGRPAAVIYAVNASENDKPVVVAPEDWIIDGVTWLKNDRLAVIAKVSKKVNDTQHLMHTWTRAVTMDVAGKDSVMLLKDHVNFTNNTNTAQFADRDIDDPDSVYMSIFEYSDMRSPSDEARDSKLNKSGDDLFRLELLKVDVRTGKFERAATGNYNTQEWFMDGHGNVVARVDQTKQPLRDILLARDGDDWKKIGDYDATADNGDGIVGVAGDGTSLVREVKGSTVVLTRVDLKTAVETPLLSNAKYDIDGGVTDPLTDRVIGGSYIDDKVEVEYFDTALENLQKGLQAAFPNTSVVAVSWNTTLDKVIVRVDSPKGAIKYYYLDRTTHAATDIGAAYPDLQPDELGAMQPYPYKARDGLDIPAYLTLPPAKPGKSLPLIVMPHGGPDYRDKIEFDWMAQFFANRGYAVFQPNYRGSAGYGEKFTEAGLHQWGLKMQDDITDGVKKLIADGVADPKRVCIIGASYGGYAALAGAAFTPDLYACAVSFAGISDLPKALSAERARYGRDSHIASFWASRIGSPFDDSEQLRATSPARHADQIKCPLLLMHGEGDTTVPIEQSEYMEDAMKRAGKQVEFIRFPDEDHYFNFADTRIRFLKETEAFVKKYIGN